MHSALSKDCCNRSTAYMQRLMFVAKDVLESEQDSTWHKNSTMPFDGVVLCISVLLKCVICLVK